MSISTDMKVEDLLRRVAALERDLAELRQALEPTPATPQQPEKRNGSRR